MKIAQRQELKTDGIEDEGTANRQPVNVESADIPGNVAPAIRLPSCVERTENPPRVGSEAEL
ncbi:hypothetical protein PTKU64_90230 (plasmid) [Paraburkholderia terrae]|uniref:Uncharacterized protein n=1 Tax=Paraburkholderia terrae TaxID=311230 RepID=A0ABM7U2Y6_9BURK|nr:hypothetical protein PTKU64_90230 [Paraburkholderia terrae]